MISLLSCYQTLDNTSVSLPSLSSSQMGPTPGHCGQAWWRGLDYSGTEPAQQPDWLLPIPGWEGEQRKEGMITRTMLTRIIHLPASAHGHSTSGPPSIPGLVSLAIQPQGDSLPLSRGFGLPFPEEHPVCIISDLCPNHTYFISSDNRLQRGKVWLF